MNKESENKSLPERKESSEWENLENRFPPNIDFEQLINILRLIEKVPNRRNSPKENDLEGNFTFWFDGGAGSAHTGGGTSYFFTNGSSAHQPYPYEPGYPNISIEFSDGRKIKIEVIEQKNAQNDALNFLPKDVEPNMETFSATEGSFCINCGSEGGEASLCENCNTIRLAMEKTATLKICQRCSRSNLMVAKFCAWCGEGF